jgi:hypothetical protein
MGEISDILAENFSKYGYTVLTKRISKFMVYVGSIFSKEIDAVYSQWGVRR